MNLRFEVNQAEAFRLGVNAPKSIVTIDVNPENLEPETRALIAKRLNGIDVSTLDEIRGKIQITGRRIIASLPTFDELLIAVQADEARVTGKPFNPPPVEERMRQAKEKADKAYKAWGDAVADHSKRQDAARREREQTIREQAAKSVQAYRDQSAKSAPAA